MSKVRPRERARGCVDPLSSPRDYLKLISLHGVNRAGEHFISDARGAAQCPAPAGSARPSALSACAARPRRCGHWAPRPPGLSVVLLQDVLWRSAACRVWRRRRRVSEGGLWHGVLGSCSGARRSALGARGVAAGRGRGLQGHGHGHARRRGARQRPPDALPQRAAEPQQRGERPRPSPALDGPPPRGRERLPRTRSEWNAVRESQLATARLRGARARRGRTRRTRKSLTSSLECRARRCLRR